MVAAARSAFTGAPPLFRGAFLASLGLAALYLALPLAAPGPLVMASIKGLVCPLLAVALIGARGRDATALRVGLALLLSAAGDVFLALDRVGFFVHGLGSFLAAHLVYIWQFAANRPRPFGMPLLRRGLAILVLLFVIGMLGVLGPNLGKLAVPVLAYIGAITVMTLAAVSLPGRPLVVAGALSFMLSDSLIALDKFVAPIPGVGPAIWITYAAAQALIVLGWLDTERE